ncbi:MAG: ABC transporter permease [Ignavibacteriae bacterium]|nr:ABC transporter permease [Ignavibacteriota bacterium]
MNNLLTTISEFVRDLKAQKLRTFLTVFGIVWGTVAIIVLLAFGMGFKRQLAINMHGIGESVAIMFPGRTTKAYEGFGSGRSISLTEEDVALLATQVSSIRNISAEYQASSVPVRVGENIINSLVAGVYPIYADMRNIIPEPGGRFINELDLSERKRVALIGNEVKRLLYGDSQVIGKIIYVGAVPFTIVGVMQKKTQNSSYNRRDADRVFIPASTFASVYGVNHLNNIIYQPKDPTRSEETGDQVRAVLGKRYKFDSTDKDAIWIWDTTKFDKFIFYFFLAFNIFMGVIGSFTLAVGGIGVANIMYIVVQERFKEIGVKRAVGATKRNIMFQFFMETFFIIGFGSLIGFLIAVGITQALQFIPIKEFVGTPEISIEVAMATMAVLSIIGLAAGFLPAKRAANLNVVECLRA